MKHTPYTHACVCVQTCKGDQEHNNNKGQVNVHEDFETGGGNNHLSLYS